MRRVTLALATVAIFWSVAAPAASVSLPKAKLDAYFDALDARGLANGSIAISQKGTLRYQRSLGFASIGPAGNAATDAGTRYRVGPVSLVFTAVLTMQLVESASITLDSKLAEFFPELPNALEITYRDLLQQRSGLPDYRDAPGLAQLRDSSAARAAILKYLETAGAKSAPRERVEFSDTNYLLLSYILEKVHEKPYAEILRREVSVKLGLPRTYLRSLDERASLEATAYLQGPQGWSAQPETDPLLHLGTSGIVSNPADLVRFLDLLFAGKVVTAHSLATMRGDGAPAAGLSTWTAAGQIGYGQSGTVDGYQSWAFTFPDSGISIAFVSNAPVLPPQQIVDEVLALIFERGHKPPSFEPVK